MPPWKSPSRRRGQPPYPPRMDLVGRRTIALVSLLAVLASFTTFTFANQLTLAWDPDSSLSSVAGYRLYEGAASQTYTNMIDVGNSTTATVSNLAPGVTYYFAVTCYTQDGSEGTPSPEITFTVPDPRPSLGIHLVSGKQVLLDVTGQPGQACTVTATRDFVTWRTVATGIVGASGSVQFSDSISNTVQFYRVGEVLP